MAEERAQRQSGEDVEQRVERLLHELLATTMRHNHALSVLGDYRRDERLATQVRVFVTVQEWRAWADHLKRVRAAISEWETRRAAWRERQQEVIEALVDLGVPLGVWFRVEDFGLRWDRDGCEVRGWSELSAELGLYLRSQLSAPLAGVPDDALAIENEHEIRGHIQRSSACVGDGRYGAEVVS